MSTFPKRATHRAITKPTFFPQTCQPQGLATLLVFDYPNGHLKRWYCHPSCRGDNQLSREGCGQGPLPPL